jgi:hypothetical protein
VPFVARASCLLAVPREVAFDRLADHDSWAAWMPGSFRPVGKAAGRLSEGLKLRVKISGTPVPISIRLTVVRRPEQICWCGGIKGVLYAEHRFSFEAKGSDAVEVLSEEAWSGFLAPLLRVGILPKAERVGRDQLGALTAAVDAKPTP